MDTQLNEEEWILRLCHGDQQAFEHLLDRYEKPIYRMIYGIIKNRQEAEDLTQEVFVKVYKKIKTFRKESKLYHWICRIALNQSRNHLARQKIVRFMSMEWLTSEKKIEFQDTSPSIDTVIERKDDLQTVLTVLDKLSDKHRELIILSEINELSYDAMADILNVPVGTIKSRLSRAKETLKHHILEGGQI